MDSIKPHIPICAKCGYDQSGEVATWQEQCPMRGRCPECGYEFNWGDVLDPSKIELDWFVEHARSVWGMGRRTIPTLWNLLIPYRYWKRVQMETPRSMKRYIGWIGLMMLVMHLATSAGLVAIHHVGLLQANAGTRAMIAQAPPAQQARLQQYIYDTQGLDYWYPLVGRAVLYPATTTTGYTMDYAAMVASLGVITASLSFMWLVLFCTFTTTRKRSKLRMVHVVRATIVSGLLGLLIIEIGRGLDVLDLAGTLWFPSIDVDALFERFGLYILLAVIIWVELFWISAIWVGWKVKVHFLEMVLVVIASFFGFVFAGGGFFVLGKIGQFIEANAHLIGL